MCMYVCMCEARHYRSYYVHNYNCAATTQQKLQNKRKRKDRKSVCVRAYVRVRLFECECACA